MAEFKEVIRQYKRLCDEMASCGPDCPLYTQFGICTGQEFLKNQSEKFEAIVMEWAKKHPEKTFMEVLLGAFPVIDTGVVYSYLCPGHLSPGWPETPGGCLRDEDDNQLCEKCWARPIPAKN